MIFFCLEKPLLVFGEKVNSELYIEGGNKLHINIAMAMKYSYGKHFLN